jgi:hypothetical protein
LVIQNQQAVELAHDETFLRGRHLAMLENMLQVHYQQERQLLVQPQELREQQVMELMVVELMVVQQILPHPEEVYLVSLNSYYPTIYIFYFIFGYF